MNLNATKPLQNLLSQAAAAAELHHSDFGHLNDGNFPTNSSEDSDHDDHQHYSSASTAKITAMCVLFMASVICGCTPFLLNKWFKWTESNGSVRSAVIVKGLLYFGGGVLLCTTFLHLVPEVAHNVESLQECHLLPEYRFHLPHLLMCMGFLAMYLVEELVHGYIHRYGKQTNVAQKAFERGHSVRNSLLVKGRAKSASLSKQDLIDGVETKAKTVEIKVTTPNSGQPLPNCHEHTHTHASEMIVDDDTVLSTLRGLLVVLALSLHELFEGLAVGLESESDRVWYMFGAVSAHKLVLAFCVGVELIATKTKRWLAITYVVAFAAVSPIGIGIGIYVSGKDSDGSAIPSVILQGLASGTLLYVVFFEILSKNRSGFINYAAFVIGFFIMFGIQFATNPGHEHSHGNCGHGHGVEEHEHNHKILLKTFQR